MMENSFSRHLDRSGNSTGENSSPTPGAKRHFFADGSSGSSSKRAKLDAYGTSPLKESEQGNTSKLEKSPERTERSLHEEFLSKYKDFTHLIEQMIQGKLSLEENKEKLFSSQEEIKPLFEQFLQCHPDKVNSNDKIYNRIKDHIDAILLGNKEVMILDIKQAKELQNFISKIQDAEQEYHHLNQEDNFEKASSEDLDSFRGRLAIFKESIADACHDTAVGRYSESKQAELRHLQDLFKMQERKYLENCSKPLVELIEEIKTAEQKFQGLSKDDKIDEILSFELNSFREEVNNLQKKIVDALNNEHYKHLNRFGKKEYDELKNIWTKKFNNMYEGIFLMQKSKYIKDSDSIILKKGA